MLQMGRKCSFKKRLTSWPFLVYSMMRDLNMGVLTVKQTVSEEVLNPELQDYRSGPLTNRPHCLPSLSENGVCTFLMNLV